jgi:hypothetical protein
MTEIIEKRKRGPQPGQFAPAQSLATATGAYGDAMPDWVYSLARASDASSQSVVAKRLNYSVSVVSAVINNKYKGSLDHIEKSVRGLLMAEILYCPVLADISQKSCVDHQRKAASFVPSSSLRTRLYQACRNGCPHSRITKKEGAA